MIKAVCKECKWFNANPRRRMSFGEMAVFANGYGTCHYNPPPSHNAGFAAVHEDDVCSHWTPIKNKLKTQREVSVNHELQSGDDGGITNVTV